MMMFYRRRASPKHCYDMIEVEYRGGGHRTRLRDQEINCCVYGVPPGHVYKGVEEGERAGPYGAPFHVVGVVDKEGEERREGRGREGGRKGGRRTPPSPIRTRGTGAAQTALVSSLFLSTMAR